MQTWTNTVYNIPDHTQPCISVLDTRRVALHLPGYMLDGRGFVLQVSVAHLERIQQLCAALEQLAAALEPPEEMFSHPVPGDPDYVGLEP